MSTLQTLLDDIAEQIIRVHPGEAGMELPSDIEFLASAAAPLCPGTLYLLSAAELPELLQRAPLPAAVFFVACGDGAPPELPAKADAAATVVFVRGGLLPFYSLLNRSLDVQRLHARIDDIILMSENAQYTPEQLVLTLSQILRIGVFILNFTYQRICGAAADCSGDPYAEELGRTGALSAESVRRIRSNQAASAVLYEVPIGKWSRFNLLLIWRADYRIDQQYLCRRIAEFVINFRNRNEPPEIPPQLIDQRLNRILEGKTSDEAEIRAYFDVGSAPVWYAVLVLGSEPGIRWGAEAYQQQVRLLFSAFRNISVTVVHSQPCAVIHIPIRHPQDAVFSRDYFNSHGYNEGWDPARLEHALQQHGVYLCRSPIFRSPRFIPVQRSLISDALDIATRMDGCRGRHIADYYDYSSYVSIKYAMERFLRKHDPDSVKVLIYPELVTLLRHDIENQTDLTSVLFHYYTYGDVNRTAQALFVHRNTVYNKLKTIQKILNVDLDDSVIRSSYLTALKIYYYCEKCLGLDLRYTK